MTEFNVHYYKCDDCSKTWIVENTLGSWYEGFKNFAKSGDCTLLREGIDNEYVDIVKPEVFYPCLTEFLEEDSGSRYEDSIRFDDKADIVNRRIVGYTLTATTITIESISNDGPALLKDVRRIERKYGLPGTFSYA